MNPVEDTVSSNTQIDSAAKLTPTQRRRERRRRKKAAETSTRTLTGELAAEATAGASTEESTSTAIETPTSGELQEAAPTRTRRRRRRTPASATATAEPSADEVTAPAEVPQASEELQETAPPRSRRRRRRTPTSATATAEPSAGEVTAPAEVPQASEEQPETAPTRTRRRRRRTPASAQAAAEASTDEATAPAEVPQASEEQPEEAAPTRTRQRRRRTPASAQAAAEASTDEATAPAEVPQASEEQPEEAAPTRTRQRRRAAPTSAQAPEPAPEGKESRYEELAEMADLPSPRKRRAEAADSVAAEGAEGKSASGSFAHPAEEEFSHLLNFYGVKWLYEPRSFPLRWEGNRTVEMFTPDFYLPEEDLFVELTTLKQSLVTEKNRKLRHLRELYPDINIKLLYRRDIHRLLAKYGYGPLADEEIQGIERVLITKPQIERRVAELGRQISADYEGEQPVLVGVLRGVACFMSDLMRQITLPLSIDFMAISTFDGSDGSGVRITKDLDIDLAGRHVLLVEDIVDTGMTLNYLLHNLTSRGTASLKVCTLLDKRVRRLADFKLDYVGFEAPDEFLVGYGLDYLEKYRNLPFIGILKPGEQPATPAGRGRRRPRKPAATV